MEGDAEETRGAGDRYLIGARVKCRFDIEAPPPYWPSPWMGSDLSRRGFTFLAGHSAIDSNSRHPEVVATQFTGIASFRSVLINQAASLLPCPSEHGLSSAFYAALPADGATVYSTLKRCQSNRPT